MVAEKYDSRPEGGHVWVHEKIKRALGCLPSDNSGLQFHIEGKDRLEITAVEELYREAYRIWSMYNNPNDPSTDEQKDAVLPQGLPNCKDGQPPVTHHFQLSNNVLNVLRNGTIRVNDGISPYFTSRVQQQPLIQRPQITYPGYIVSTPSPQVAQWAPYPPPNNPQGPNWGRSNSPNNNGWGGS